MSSATASLVLRRQRSQGDASGPPAGMGRRDRQHPLDPGLQDVPRCERMAHGRTVYVAFVDIEPDPAASVTRTGPARLPTPELEGLDAAGAQLRSRGRDRPDRRPTTAAPCGPTRAPPRAASACAGDAPRAARSCRRTTWTRCTPACACCGGRRARPVHGRIGPPGLEPRTGGPVSPTAAVVGAAAWHDVECASYAADLGVWRDLAAERGGPVLDVGAGTGRVALDLAARGHAVVAIDADPDLVPGLRRARARTRAGGAGPRGRRTLASTSARPTRWPSSPMQVAQLLGGRRGRRAMLDTVGAHLDPGGLLAVALADPFGGVPAGEFLPPLPDVLRGGWLGALLHPGGRPRRGRLGGRRPSPPGGLARRRADRGGRDALARLRQPARARGGGGGGRASQPLPALEVPATRDYVGSSDRAAGGAGVTPCASARSTPS